MTKNHAYFFGVSAAVLFVVAAFAFALSPATTNANGASGGGGGSSTTPQTVDLYLNKHISGENLGFELSDFSYHVTGNGVDVVVPHDNTTPLGVGTYTIEELVPTGFVKEDWRIGWYGQCDAGDLYSTTITIDDGNVDHGILYCEADNQYRPENPDEEEDIPGCTDDGAINYDSDATTDDGSCEYDNGDDTPKHKVEGYVWHDEDEDGVIDEEESYLEGWTITLSNGSTSLETQTDAEGYYSFDEVPSGSWVLSESLFSGWHQVFPSPETYEIELTDEEAEGVTLGFPLNLFVNVAFAQVPNFFNFGNALNGGGGGGGSSDDDDDDGGGRRILGVGSSGGGPGGSSSSDDNDPVEPVPEVLSEQVSVIPVGAPNAGFGGTATDTTLLTFVIFGLLGSLGAFGFRSVIQR